MVNGEAWDGCIARKMRKRLSYDTWSVWRNGAKHKLLVNDAYKGGGEVMLKYGVFFAEQLCNESPGYKLL